MLDEWAKVVTPIWSAEMGERLKTARKKRDWDQEDLAGSLEVTQPSISRVERGLTKVIPGLSLHRLQLQFQDLTGYILTGAGSDRIDKGVINEKYWRKRTRNQFGAAGETKYAYKIGKSRV